jgi:site-specific recombinase XerD
MKTILIEPVIHSGEPRIKLIFDYDDELIGLVKKIPGSLWSRTLKCWHVPEQENLMEFLIEYLPEVRFEWVKDTPAKENDIQIMIAETDKRKNIFYISLPFAMKDEFKKLEGAWWHPGARKWSAVDNADNRSQLRSILEKAGYSLEFREKEEPEKPLRPTREGNKENKDLPLPDERFERQMRLEGKSENTIRQYKSFVSWYLSVQTDEQLAEDAAEKVRRFIYDHVIKKDYGQTQQNGAISALKQYYQAVFGIVLDATDIPRPKKKRVLPKVISKEEFEKMYRATRNLKHQVILLLLFGCGLRRQEVCELRTSDTDFERGLLYIKGKGNKYRAVNPGNNLLEKLAKYIKSYMPEKFLIEGPNRGMYSGSSIGKIVSVAASEAGIERRVHPHMLRHSFATLLMERGVELRLIQEALGHSSSKTTEIYTYVSRATIKKMPVLLDEMKI